MDINPLQRSVRAEDIPLERLAGNSSVGQQEKVEEVSRQFESMLLRHILQEGQKPLIKSKYNDHSLSGDIYKDMITQELAEQMSRSGDFGLASSLELQLGKELSPSEPSSSDPSIPRDL